MGAGFASLHLFLWHPRSFLDAPGVPRVAKSWGDWVTDKNMNWSGFSSV
ncbi:hypothetical protein HMPREF0578_1141 [Mobiluncus mulieris 28-1]|nr:hypothetical protein HMPREF0578_1141 [Mobiluncus mulieris 28-1]